MVSLYCRGSLQKALSSRITSRILPAAPHASVGHRSRRRFHSTPAPWGIRSQVLKDVGEGITEVQIIQWYVEEGARIEEWKPLCQYQSDKAVDDITSRYEGVIKKLHFQADDTVPTGMALCDIEVDDAQYPEAKAPAAQTAASTPTPAPEPTTSTSAISQEAAQEVVAEVSHAQIADMPTTPRSKFATFATPAVRGMLKDHGLDITQITGTGKDGRVMKEDVLKFIAQRDAPAAAPAAQPAQAAVSSPAPSLSSPQVETPTALSPIQSQMFKTMTKSLTIPHFLYADELSISALATLRKKILTMSPDTPKISYLPFIIKAVSLSLQDFPLLNARVDTTTNPNKPTLVMRANHNIGVAMDTPTGLLVPNIKNVQARSITDIAAELVRLSGIARAGKLTPADLSGGTITVSNIGTIGGTYVAPVLVPTEIAILGVGKARTVPVFDAHDNVVKDQKMTFSWSADHRVIDGATMARMAEKVRQYVEEPEKMLLAMR